ncbi:MAG: hypothetical protein KBG75_03580 [Pseudomonadales bacterium]|nr:hypothetical protein [Pseudomonadales bacterium]
MNTKFPVIIASIAVLLALVAGCAGYSYTVNERTVFEKPALFAEYEIADEGLSTCVEQAIKDGGISSAEALENLNCSSAGIASLQGIEVFSKLRGIGIDDNAINDLSPLYTLAKLELLQARDNALESIDTRLCQGSAKQIALAGNDKLACADIVALRACGMTIIDQPAHCTSP